MESNAGLDGANAVAVLERAQLLERFGPLERRLRQRGERQQELAAEGVQADVLEAHAVFPAVGDRRAREIQRVAVAIDDDLHDVRVVVVRRVDEAPARAVDSAAGRRAAERGS